MNKRSISGNNTEQVLQSQITDLQDNVVVTGTNFGVSPGTFTMLTTGSNNVAVGNGAAGGQYGNQTGNNNVMLGYNTGAGCQTGSNNTFLGSNTSMYEANYVNGSIALGSGATITGYNQLMVATNVTQFNIPGLAASTGTGAGTILEFDLTGNILPTAGTYKTVSAIDTAIVALQDDIIVSGTNMAIGGESFGTTVTGMYCTATGDWALKSLTTGGWNTAFGYNALNSVTAQNSNVGVGDSALTSCIGDDNTAVGSSALHELTSGGSNVGIGLEAASSLTTGTNNICIGTSSNVYSDACSKAIILGASATNTASNQLYISPSVTSFNISGLAASTGSGAGTILEFDLASNILPTAGTYKTVSAIDTAIASIDAPYAMSWAANSEYTYDSSTTIQALAIWDTANFGNSANMATKTTWTCPAAGLWHIAATFGYSMNTNDESCSFRLYQNGAEVWYFTAWYNIATAGEGITTQCESIFLNLAAGDTLEWYLLLSGSITLTIGGGNQNSGNTTFNAIRIAPGYTAA